ncbi:MAG: hypothetical protein EHM59_22180, partial [Betaproteobacteria bacterium]
MEKSQSSGFLDSAGARPRDEGRRQIWSLEEWEFGVVFIALYLVIERISFIEPWAETGITPWNPRVALVFGVVLLRGLRAMPAVLLAMVLAEGLVRVTPTSMPIIFLCAGASALG